MSAAIVPDDIKETAKCLFEAIKMLEGEPSTSKVNVIAHSLFAERQLCAERAKHATMMTGAPLEEMGDEVAAYVMIPLKRERFWMVLGIGQGVPRYQHGTKEGAQAEAKRLAGAHPEIMFVVLEVVDAYRSEAPTVNQFQIVEADPAHTGDDDIPF